MLLVTDAGVTCAGWPARVAVGIEAAGLKLSLFSQVTPNPREHEVMAGAGIYGAERCDGIVAGGGGSAI